MANADVTRARSPVARSLDGALALIGASGIALGIGFLSLVLPGSPIGWMYGIAVIVFWTFLAAGLLAWRRRPSNGMGVLIVLGGFALYFGFLVDTGIPVLVVVSEVCATLVLAVTFHLLHAFPSGRLRGWFSRSTVIAGYIVCVVLQAPHYLFDRRSAVQVLFIADRPDLLELGLWVQRGAGFIVTVATAIVLISRLLRSDPIRRRVLVPVFGYGIFAVLFWPLGPLVLGGAIGVSPLIIVLLQFLVVGGIPVAFALGVLRGGFARTSELQELGAWLGSAGAARPALTAAVARTLGDDTVRVLFWTTEREEFVDADGVPTPLPAKESGRAAATIELDDRLVGALEYDSVLIADERIVHAAGRVVAIAVDRQRLTAELLASQHELRRSRSRLIQAAETERRRIARDLHDGIQVQLVLLALQAGQLAHAAEATHEFRRDATTLRKGIDSAAGGLREFVHAVMPTTLIEHGLSAAAEDLVDRMPLATTIELDIGDEPLSQVIESAAYFVLAEGLTNTLKHSKATACAVRLNRAGGWLFIDVHDNGVGGASFENGAGLSGLKDRVDALGGTLRITSSAVEGTRLSAELPCGS